MVVTENHQSGRTIFPVKVVLNADHFMIVASGRQNIPSTRCDFPDR